MEKELVDLLLKEMNKKIEEGKNIAVNAKKREEFGLELVGLLYKYDLISWEKVQQVIDPITQAIQYQEEYLRALEEMKNIENPWEPWGDFNEEKYIKMIESFGKFKEEFNPDTHHKKSGLLELLNMLPEALSMGDN